MKTLARLLRWLGLKWLADKIDPPKVDINGNPVTNTGGGPSDPGGP